MTINLSGSLAALAFLAILPAGAPAESAHPERECRVRFFHTRTGERLDIVYRIGGRYLPDALAKLNYYLRDSFSQNVHAYAPEVFDLLHDLTAAVGAPNAEINVICGYRTLQTNKFLRARTSGVALRSLHMEAKAIDIRLPGISTAKLRDAALALHRGGVGYYAQSSFVHVDVGPIRRW